MYNKVELCGVNTGQLPVLTEAEKRQLLTLAHAGDKAARARMVEGNLRLVLSVVQRFAQRGENLDDLFQVGCIGLIKAIDNFDPAQPVRFSTYGVPMIIGEIRRFLRDNNALRVSRTLRDTAYRAMQARETLEKQLGREPTMDEIAAAAGLARREVTAALESVVEPLSLDEPVYTDGGDAMYVIDQVRDPDSEESWISGLQFRDTVAALSPREKRIMELRYLRGKTQMEVAQEIGISQAQVSRLEKGAQAPERVPSQQKRPLRSAAVFFGLQRRLYLRRVAAPPRRWRSALLRASTARTCPYSAGLMLRSRTATSLCTVDLLHPNAAAAARTVALWAAMYSPSCTARCSGSAFISRLPAFQLCNGITYAPPGRIMSAGLTFCLPARILWADIKTGAP